MHAASSCALSLVGRPEAGSDVRWQARYPTRGTRIDLIVFSLSESLRNAHQKIVYTMLEHDRCSALLSTGSSIYADRCIDRSSVHYAHYYISRFEIFSLQHEATRRSQIENAAWHRLCDRSFSTQIKRLENAGYIFK